MSQHRRLARARAGDDEQGPGTFRIPDSMLDRELLLGIEIDGRARANQGERHGATQPCFALCSQGRLTGAGRREAVDRVDNRPRAAISKVAAMAEDLVAAFSHAKRGGASRARTATGRTAPLCQMSRRRWASKCNSSYRLIYS